MNKGWLIVFEGIDGTGKTTQIQKIAELLRSQGEQVIETKEPTDGPFGQKIRELYTNRNKVTREQELELFIEDRRQHVQECIQPALDQGMVVLSDRYYYSTAAYQGASGADPQDIFRRNHFAPVPDVALFLTLETEHSLQRIRESRGESPNDFEQREQLEKVADLFDSFTQPEIVRINAAGTITIVHNRIQEALCTRTPLLHALKQ